MIQFEQFTGGALDTNAFLVKGPSGNVLIDAPQGTGARFAAEKIGTLVLTHGHFDHVADAAAIRRGHDCRVGFHPDTLPMVSDREFFRQWGFNLEVEPVECDFPIVGTDALDLGGIAFRVLEVPGHCPGSICLYSAEHHALFGGDVLFRGGIGRWDLPGGDMDLLLSGIREKILPLPENTRVFPGHGPATTVGIEKRSNPWLQL